MPWTSHSIASTSTPQRKVATELARSMRTEHQLRSRSVYLRECSLQRQIHLSLSTREEYPDNVTSADSWTSAPSLARAGEAGNPVCGRYVYARVCLRGVFTCATIKDGCMHVRLRIRARNTSSRVHCRYNTVFEGVTRDEMPHIAGCCTTCPVDSALR